VAGAAAPGLSHGRAAPALGAAGTAAATACRLSRLPLPLVSPVGRADACVESHGRDPVSGGALAAGAARTAAAVRELPPPIIEGAALTAAAVGELPPPIIEGAALTAAAVGELPPPIIEGAALTAAAVRELPPPIIVGYVLAAEGAPELHAHVPRPASEMTALLKVGTKCTAPSLIETHGVGFVSLERDPLRGLY
jgi:hypothetical protein